MRHWLRKQWRRRLKPLGFLWKWAKRGKRKGEVSRWVALKHWAAHREEAARKRHDWKAMRKWHRIRLVYRRRMRRKIRWIKHHPHEDPPKAAGTTLIDGRAVPNWMVPKLKEIRARGRWRGYVVSGFRTPAYSESLCRAMCGAPTCPGRCAGRYSNHACPPSATCQAYEGAIDVSDYITFAAEAHAVGAPFYNALPFDRVHFSHSGN
jgi:hypothetical protein